MFVKYDGLKYNIIDAEKNSQLITTSSEAELGGNSHKLIVVSCSFFVNDFNDFILLN